MEAEERAAVSAKEGLSKKLRDAEQRAEMLQDQITELEMSLERQRAAADARCVSLPEQHLHAMSFWITLRPKPACTIVNRHRVEACPFCRLHLRRH